MRFGHGAWGMEDGPTRASQPQLSYYHEARGRETWMAYGIASGPRPVVGTVPRNCPSEVYTEERAVGSAVSAVRGSVYMRSTGFFGSAIGLGRLQDPERSYLPETNTFSFPFASPPPKQTLLMVSLFQEANAMCMYDSNLNAHLKAIVLATAARQNTGLPCPGYKYRVVFVQSMSTAGCPARSRDGGLVVCLAGS